MENIFLKYMKERFKLIENVQKEPGPVITISREYGCYASEIARLFVNEINNDGLKAKWDWVSNEILLQVAKNLRVNPNEIAHIFGAERKSLVDEFLRSFNLSKSNTTDDHIINNITQVVARYANYGNFVIVGRAGCVIAKNIKKSLHVRINAPLDWRIQSIAKRFTINEDEARKKITENDMHRKQFMSFFKGDKPHSELYDIELNRSTLTNEQIVLSIKKMAELKKLIDTKHHIKI